MVFLVIGWLSVLLKKYIYMLSIKCFVPIYSQCSHLNIFDNLSPEGGCSERLDAFRFFLNIYKETKKEKRRYKFCFKEKSEGINKP